MQALLYALPSVWQCWCWQWFTIYSIYFRFGRWPGASEESSPASLLNTQGPFSIFPLADGWASCPPIPGLYWPWGNDSPWESERQCSSSSCSAALLSRRSWIVLEAAKLLVYLLGRGVSWMYTLSTSALPLNRMWAGCMSVGLEPRCKKAQHLRAPWLQKDLFLLTGTLLACKGDFKSVWRFSQDMFPALVLVIFFKNSNNKNRAYALFAVNFSRNAAVKKCCCI